MAAQVPPNFPQPQPDFHSQQTDGLSKLSDKMNLLVTDIGITSTALNKTLDGLYNTYIEAIDSRRHLVNDIDQIIQNNEQAKQALKDAESKYTNAEQQRKSADQERQNAEKKHSELQEKMQQLQETQARFEQEKNAAQARAAQLEQANQELQSLHRSQVVQIKTNIQTLGNLKSELDKLHDQIKIVYHQSLAYGCIKLYIKYPLLIKIRNIAAKGNILDNNVTIQGLTISITNLMPLITKDFQTILSEINRVITSLKSISPQSQQGQQSQLNGFWENYKTKIESVINFFSSKAFNTSLTWGTFLMYQWKLERLISLSRERKTELIEEEGLKTIITQITTDLISANESNY
jgi:vacuolar-type H+-ATPase subunit I/STV1